ncbi:MAG: aglS [Acidimicrobiaceae bacterium]|nr:aglS [Acidimicrobiaceae bacterium]
MPITIPGKKLSARLRQSKVFGKKGGFGGRKSAYASLQLTPMVDMFTIIVIYLLANFSDNGDILFMTKEITLPDITSKVQLKRAPVISISASAVSVDGAKVTDVDEITRQPSLNIPALEEVMREKRRNAEQSQTLLGGQQFDGTVNFQVDKAVRFNVLKRVMAACNVAGYGAIAFAGMQTSGAGPPRTAANL